MKVGVIGLGNVGTTTAAMLQYVGAHAVTAYDVDEDRRDRLRDGDLARSEAALDRYLPGGDRYVGSIRIADAFEAAVAAQDCVVVCVGTTARPDDRADDSQLVAVMDGLVRHSDRTAPPWIIVRSTALPAEHAALTAKLPPALRTRYVVHPEFMREGSSVDDFLTRDLEVFGADPDAHPALRRFIERLYPTQPANGRQFVPIAEAALVKYASNLLHAAKVAFANEIGVVCGRYAADSRLVMSAVRGSALNTSGAYLHPGLPYGGSCLPKDAAAVAAAADGGIPLLRSIEASNARQLDRLTEAVLELRVGGDSRRTHYGLYGLAFKATTDDCRGSVPVRLAQDLLGLDHRVTAYDPLVRDAPVRHARFSITDAADGLRDCDVVVVCHRIAAADTALIESATVFDAVGIPPALRQRTACYRGIHWP